MKYILLCYHEEQTLEQAGPLVIQEAIEEVVQSMCQLQARGQYILSTPLHPVATATSVRVRDGKRVVTDGPFAETREVLGGFYLIDVNDLDEAIAIAGQQPGARLGTIEIRPVLELAGLPKV